MYVYTYLSIFIFFTNRVLHSVCVCIWYDDDIMDDDNDEGEDEADDDDDDDVDVDVGVNVNVFFEANPSGL